MLRLPQRLVLSGVAFALVVGLGLVAWGPTTGSSEAQSGTMHNCPAAGKWSIAVWEGDSGTAAADALATCGAGAVDAAYALDPQTGGWLGWFRGRPEVSKLTALDGMQGVLAVGGTAAAGAAGAERLAAAEAAGQVRNCPPAGKWSIAVWDGPNGTAATDALATCGADAVDAAYSLDPQMGGWLGCFRGRPEVSKLATLDDKQGMLALGSATAPSPTATPVPSPTSTQTPKATPTRTPTPTPTPSGPELGTWSGTTSQGKPIEFDVVEGSRAISRIKFEAEGTCGAGCTCDVESETQGTHIAEIVDDAFSYSNSSLDISGTFESTTTASGDLDYHRSGVGPYDPGCDSGPVTWTASLQ